MDAFCLLENLFFFSYTKREARSRAGVETYAHVRLRVSAAEAYT